MNIERKENKIRFVDTDGIEYKLWKKFLARINYLGYDMDIDQLIEYFKRGTFLNEDQSLEVMKILGMAHIDDSIDENEIAIYNQKAKEHFGITNDLNLAGYLLTDGTLLKLSYDNYMRDIDHRDIKEVLTHIDTSDNNAAAMIHFINYGNIRITSRCIEILKIPTEKQRPVIARLIQKAQRDDYTYMAVDIATTTGQVIKTLEYDYPLYGKVISDIESYFASIQI